MSEPTTSRVLMTLASIYPPATRREFPMDSAVIDIVVTPELVGILFNTIYIIVVNGIELTRLDDARTALKLADALPLEACDIRREDRFLG